MAHEELYKYFKLHTCSNWHSTFSTTQNIWWPISNIEYGEGKTHQEKQIHQDIEIECWELVALITVIPHKNLYWRYHGGVK
jgi:hypothetical protein